MAHLRGAGFTEVQVNPISRRDGSRRKAAYPAARPRDNEPHGGAGNSSLPGLPKTGLSRAEREKTEALKRSVLELIEVHQAALLWLTNKAVTPCHSKADC